MWRSFNGATAFQRWKLCTLLQEFVNGDTPSMGPPPFSDGNFALYYRSLSMGIHLQWGHRLSAMETCLNSSMSRSSQSFNGATAFQRWKLVYVLGSANIRKFLQWGHRLSAMETPVWICPPAWVTVLQWGHRLSAMETLAWSVQHDNRRVHLQWGHRLSAMETW